MCSIISPPFWAASRLDHLFWNHFRPISNLPFLPKNKFREVSLLSNTNSHRISDEFQSGFRSHHCTETGPCQGIEWTTAHYWFSGWCNFIFTWFKSSTCDTVSYLVPQTNKQTNIIRNLCTNIQQSAHSLGGIFGLHFDNKINKGSAIVFLRKKEHCQSKKRSLPSRSWVMTASHPNLIVAAFIAAFQTQSKGYFPSPSDPNFCCKADDEL